MSDKYRFERKYISNNLNADEVEFILLRSPSIFREQYKRRYVNNIYFDTEEYSMYEDSVVGTARRLKIRLRWYGSFFGRISPFLEFKSKIGNVNSKQIYEIPSFIMKNNLKNEKIVNLLKSQNIPDSILELLSHLKARTANRYTRRYFISFDNKIRATIDSNQQFYGFAFTDGVLVNKIDDNENIILEFKYDNQAKIDNIIHLTTGMLPFRLTKNSKYVNSINLQYS